MNDAIGRCSRKRCPHRCSRIECLYYHLSRPSATNMEACKATPPTCCTTKQHILYLAVLPVLKCVYAILEDIAPTILAVLFLKGCYRVTVWTMCDHITLGEPRLHGHESNTAPSAPGRRISDDGNQREYALVVNKRTRGPPHRRPNVLSLSRS